MHALYIILVAGTDVCQEIALLEREFTDLRCHLVSELNLTTHVSVDMVLDSLTTLPMFLRPQYENPLQERLSMFESTTSFSQLFRRLDPLLTFIDYPGLLSHLISMFGSGSLRQEINLYGKKLVIFLSQTTVADLMDFWPGRQFPDFAKLKVKFDGDPKSFTLEKLNEFRRKFASQLRLSELIFILIGCEHSNSFFATWMVHPSIVYIIVERSKSITDDFYLGEQILYLSIGEAQLHPNETTMTLAKKSGLYTSQMASEMTTPFSKDEFVKIKSCIQQGIKDCIVDYNDIMIIGRTGMGKSTTSDKLVIANLKNRDYRGEPYVEETMEEGRMVMSDLSMWLVSDVEGDIYRVTQRLKNLVMFRGLENPHQEVNDFYMKESEQTTKFQLISNETTMVRILDVPGFFGMDHVKPASESVTRGLTIMREILRIQAAMRMNFKRILYFLPERGSLEKCHEILRMELEQMVHYFGKSIFDCMVLVATVNPDIYQYLQPGVTPFSDDAEMKTRKSFQIVLSLVLPPGEQLPNLKPPIVFISMNDTCEDIYTKIERAPVIFDRVRMAFSHRMCAQCGIKVKALGKGEKEIKVACYIGEDPSQCIPYEESHCHPMIISKHWKITKVLGGIAHVITGKKFMGKWSDFRNPDDEICVNCGAVPGSRGCLPVNTYYELKGGQLKVDHKCKLNEPVVIENSGGEHQALLKERQPPAATGGHMIVPVND